MKHEIYALDRKGYKGKKDNSSETGEKLENDLETASTDQKRKVSTGSAKEWVSIIYASRHGWQLAKNDQ